MVKNHDIYKPLYTDKEHFIILVTGGRGCEAPDTPVMMSDMTVKQIKDIVVGDKVMGDDGTPRNVLNVVRGRSMMYKVHQANAEDYVVSDSHILCLFNTESKEIEEVSLFRYMESPYGYKGIINRDGKAHYTDICLEQVGEGDYCGITIDGNHRYLSAYGTVKRNSGKSFAVGTFIERLTFELGVDEETAKRIAHQILYTRYTMVSANISVIPEFMEKIDADGTGKYFHSTKTDVENLMTKSKVMFRGIRTSSGNQTAKLKSIHGITTFVVDEAEEWTSEREYETIMLSIRQKGLQNRIVIIMNPTDSNHFIYQKYIKDTHKMVDYDGVPVQISTHPNVLHIHTSYLDNIEHLSEQFIEEAKAMKEKNPEKYAHLFMGQWADVAEGAIFKKWGIVKEFPKGLKKVAKGLDFGYTCFSGDTMIMTDKGEIPIRDINPGDMVLTRRGYRRVKNKMYNGRKQVLKRDIEVGDQIHTIKATLEHNFNVNGKWKQYGQLEKGDNLFTLPSSTARPTSDTQMGNTPIISITKRCEVEKNNTQSCIRISMNITKDRYQRERLSTILMEIHSTTISATLLQSLLQNIQRFIRNFKSMLLLNGRNRLVSQKRIGVAVGRKLMNLWQTLSRFVSDVVRSLLQPTLTKCFAHILVTINGNTQVQSAMCRWFANGAEKSLWETNTSNQRHVVTSVPITSHGIKTITDLGEEIYDVYDLEIEGVHEYFANGILVHNCDPSACVKCGIDYSKGTKDLYIDEKFYKTGMLIKDLVAAIKDGEDGELFVYADSADPRLIQEIANNGIIIYPVMKGGGSIIAGIEGLLDFDNIFVTESSLNMQNEMRNYTWDKDKDGNYINQPIDAYNHCEDALRYWYLGHILGQVIGKRKFDESRSNIF